VDGKRIEWEERCLLIRSKAYAEAQIAAFRSRVDRAEAALRRLTPTPGRGKRQIRDEETLVAEIQAIVAKYRVDHLFDIHYERQVSQRNIRAYRDKPARIEETVRYQITVQRRKETIEREERTLGWRIYATNSSTGQLTLTDAVLAYRGQYVVERIFGRLKGRYLSITPMYVQRDDHALGLIRLLTLAARLMAVADYTARCALAEAGTALAGVYAGNPERSTLRPTLERMLRAFRHITLTVVRLPEGEVRHVTPLTEVQQRILALLGVSPALYTGLATA
jgi:transposase